MEKAPTLDDQGLGTQLPLWLQLSGEGRRIPSNLRVQYDLPQAKNSQRDWPNFSAGNSIMGYG